MVVLDNAPNWDSPQGIPKPTSTWELEATFLPLAYRLVLFQLRTLGDDFLQGRKFENPSTSTPLQLDLGASYVYLYLKWMCSSYVHHLNIISLLSTSLKAVNSGLQDFSGKPKHN